MAPARSPLAPAAVPAVPPIGGARFATGESGIRYKGRDDVLLALFDAGTTVAGVFTKSSTAAAPVAWCRKALAGGQARAFIVNAGNANAFTGKAGMGAVDATVGAAARALGCPRNRVFVASTGVIGQRLKAERIAAMIPGLAGAARTEAWDRAAAAIMTTDTFPKLATASATIDGVPVTINGTAKGSGMIAPDMATMIAFVATDARLPADVLQACLARATERSFNRTTVDSDTSTNDTLLAFATGAAGHASVTRAADRRLAGFRAALEAVCLDLALQVVRDGEGAQKLIEIRVAGARSAAAARRVAFGVANSPLVKTAIAGADANWGRVVMAVGKADITLDQRRIGVRIGGHVVATRGGPPKDYDETPVTAHMKGRSILIAIELGQGRAATTVWTCDLTHGYIDINADYRS
ncbi:MAG: bifunctional glutamate N-acetyltransferase/amino-acid acetyltransferase ArgJ [Alphaproteobacteria bacterium]|nr:bifunctional glutamate N-acetyltransferase/amino-acid acetyltransferase ArgJ [Alphaproteobacteria bacterium]